MWSRINVQSIKPTLSARNVYVIKGMHNNGVRGGRVMVAPWLNDIAVRVTCFRGTGCRAPKHGGVR